MAAEPVAIALPGVRRLQAVLDRLEAGEGRRSVGRREGKSAIDQHQPRTRSGCERRAPWRRSRPSSGRPRPAGSSVRPGARPRSRRHGRPADRAGQVVGAAAPAQVGRDDRPVELLREQRPGARRRGDAVDREHRGAAAGQIAIRREPPATGTSSASTIPHVYHAATVVELGETGHRPGMSPGFETGSALNIDSVVEEAALGTVRNHARSGSADLEDEEDGEAGGPRSPRSRGRSGRSRSHGCAGARRGRCRRAAWPGRSPARPTHDRRRRPARRARRRP